MQLSYPAFERESRRKTDKNNYYMAIALAGTSLTLGLQATAAHLFSTIALDLVSDEEVCDALSHLLSRTADAAKRVFHGVRARFSKQEFIPPPPKILVVAHMPAGGCGDLSGAAKIAKALEETRYSVELAVKVSKRPILNLFRDIVPKCVTYFTDLGKFLNRSRAALTVHYPVNLVHPPVGSDTLYGDGQMHLGLLEYGYSHEQHKTASILDRFFGKPGIAVEALGAGAGERGLIFDEGLRQFSQSACSKSMRCRLGELASLPELVQKAIFHGRVSQDAIEQFMRSGQELYLGYSAYAFAKDAFVEIVAGLSTVTQPTFVLIGREIGLLSNPSLRIPPIAQRLFMQLANFGYGRAELTQVDPSAGDLTIRNISLNSDEISRAVRIISMPRIEHAHMRTLLRASEQVVLDTGDQFHGEALSSRKITIYESASHKRQFRHSLVFAATSVDIRLVPLASHLFTALDASSVYADDVTGEEAHESRAIRALTSAVDKLRKQPDLWSDYLEYLYTHHDAMPFIKATVAGLV